MQIRDPVAIADLSDLVDHQVAGVI